MTPIPPNQPTPIGLGGLFGRLDIKGDRLPGLSADVVPVIIYGDMSQSLASEVFEARGHFGSVVQDVGGNWAAFEMQARSAGGSVVEALTVGSDDDTYPFVRFDIVSASPFTTPTLLSFVNIGGIACSNVIRRDTGAVAFIGGAFGSQLFGQQGVPGVGLAGTSVPLAYPLHRIFVPAGRFLVFQNGTVGRSCLVAFTWRELAAIQGSQ